MEFKMYENPAKNGYGYIAEFITRQGKHAMTWFSNPPSDIDHVDVGYLKERLHNVKGEGHVKFIKKRFKEEAERLGIED